MTTTKFFRPALGISLLVVLGSVITSVEGQQQMKSQSENSLGQFEQFFIWAFHCFILYPQKVYGHIHE